MANPPSSRTLRFAHGTCLTTPATQPCMTIAIVC